MCFKRKFYKLSLCGAVVFSLDRGKIFPLLHNIFFIVFIFDFINKRQYKKQKRRRDINKN